MTRWWAEPPARRRVAIAGVFAISVAVATSSARRTSLFRGREATLELQQKIVEYGTAGDTWSPETEMVARPGRSVKRLQEEHYRQQQSKWAKKFWVSPVYHKLAPEHPERAFAGARDQEGIRGEVQNDGWEPGTAAHPGAVAWTYLLHGRSVGGGIHTVSGREGPDEEQRTRTPQERRPGRYRRQDGVRHEREGRWDARSGGSQWVGARELPLEKRPREQQGGGNERMGGRGDPSEAGRTWARDGDYKSLQRGGGSGSFAELKRRFREQQARGGVAREPEWARRDDDADGGGGTGCGGDCVPADVVAPFNPLSQYEHETGGRALAHPPAWVENDRLPRRGRRPSAFQVPPSPAL